MIESFSAVQDVFFSFSDAKNLTKFVVGWVDMRDLRSVSKRDGRPCVSCVFTFTGLR